LTRIHYHPCPQALGEYDYATDTIILHEGLKRYRELEHARIFLEHRGWPRRLVLNVRLDYGDRITGATRVSLKLLRELQPSSLGYDLFRALYLLAYLPLVVAEGFVFTVKSFLGSE
jgi:hypothetical protein